MLIALKHRLARLERGRPPAAKVEAVGAAVVFIGDGETEADAIARAYPQGQPPGAPTIIVRFIGRLAPEDEDADDDDNDTWKEP